MQDFTPLAPPQGVSDEDDLTTPTSVVETASEEFSLTKPGISILSEDEVSNRKNTGRHRLTKKDWEKVFTRRAFTGEWRLFYENTREDFRQQYGALGPQYGALLDQAAVLLTQINAMVANHAPLGLIMRQRDQLLRYLAQLSKYTESEKREITTKTEVLHSAMVAVIAIAQSTIAPDQQERFFAALETKFANGRDVTVLGPPTFQSSPVLKDGRNKE